MKHLGHFQRQLSRCAWLACGPAQEEQKEQDEQEKWVRKQEQKEQQLRGAQQDGSSNINIWEQQLRGKQQKQHDESGSTSSWEVKVKQQQLEHEGGSWGQKIKQEQLVQGPSSTWEQQIAAKVGRQMPAGQPGGSLCAFDDALAAEQARTAAAQGECGAQQVHEKIRA